MKQKSVSRTVAIAAISVLLAGGALTVLAADPAPELPDVLKDKGLVISENRLVLPIESQLHDSVKALRIAKAKANEEAAKRKQVDAEVTSTKQLIKNMDAEYARLNDLLATEADPSKQNQIIGRTNSIVTQQKTQQSNLEALIEKQKALNAAKEALIEQVAEISKSIDADEHAYDEITKDTDLATAVTDYNKTAKVKLKLGPSNEYTEGLKFVKKSLAEVSIEVVTVSTEHGVPEVEATLNGKTKQMMVWDSGASSVVLTTEMAAAVGLHPTDKDPVVHCKLARRPAHQSSSDEP